MTIATQPKRHRLHLPVVVETRSPKAKIFGTDADLWTSYEARLDFRDKLIGGIPKDPRLIEGWLRARAGLDDPLELRLVALQTLAQAGADELPIARQDPIDLATQQRTTGFKTGPDGLYVEGRQVKAMLKESTNIVFAGERWGPTRKAAKSFFAERVFVDPDQITLGLFEPSGVETVVGHLSGPSGPRSTLNKYEYVQHPSIQFRVRVLRDCVSAEQWRAIWCHAQENGFGTLRSQGFGRFDVVKWSAYRQDPADHA
jgi:hypothetical protein